jgi:hypothetical protein
LSNITTSWNYFLWLGKKFSTPFSEVVLVVAESWWKFGGKVLIKAFPA